eukprot:GHVR01155183.1.p1 GENE.GHVR01155183.1~~GHVR01155183.1.p1  ORF type:complete len:164 (+),score=38.52 GHVR01155183.1:116-607(+)
MNNLSSLLYCASKVKMRSAHAMNVHKFAKRMLVKERTGSTTSTADRISTVGSTGSTTTTKKASSFGGSTGVGGTTGVNSDAGIDIGHLLQTHMGSVGVAGVSGVGGGTPNNHHMRPSGIVGSFGADAPQMEYAGHHPRAHILHPAGVCAVGFSSGGTLQLPSN